MTAHPTGDRPAVVTERILGSALVITPLAIVPGLYHFADLPKLALVCVFALLAAASTLLSPSCLRFSKALLLPLAAFTFVVALQFARGLNPAAASLPLVMQIGCATIAVVVGSVIRLDRMRTLLICAAVGGALGSAVGLFEVMGLGHGLLPSSGRPGATFGFRNAAASYMIIGLPLAGSLLFERRSTHAWFGSIAAATMGAFLIHTRSRGAWLGLSVALVLGLVAWGMARRGGRRQGRTMSLPRLSVRAAGMGALLLIVLVALPNRIVDTSASRLDEKKEGILSTLQSVREPGGDRGRVDIWRSTIRMIADKPLLGVGLGNWGAAFYPYDRGRILGLASDPRRPHSDFLWICAELGLIGFLAYLWLLGVAASRVWRAATRGKGETRIVALAIGMGMAAYLVHSAFSFPREWAASSMLFWVGVGVAGQVGEGREGSIARRHLAVAAVLCAAAVLVCYRATRFDRLLYQAAVAQHAGQVERELAAATGALAYGSFDHRAYLHQANGLIRTGQVHASIRAYERLLKVQPNSPAAHNNLGQAYAAAGALRQARESLQKALELVPDEPTVMNNLALVHQKDGRPQAAAELFARINRGDPGALAQARLNHGFILAEAGDLDKAEEAYEEALALDPKLEIIRYNLAGLWMLKEEYRRAAEEFERYLSGDPDSAYARRARNRLGELYPALGDSLLKSGNYTEAGRIYERLASLGEADASAFNNLAILRRRSGDREGAVDAARLAIGQDSTRARSYFILGELLAEGGDSAGAMASYEAFLERWEGDGGLAGEARRRLGTLRDRGNSNPPERD